MGGPGSGLYPMVDFGISGLEPSKSVTRVCGCYLVHL